MYARREVKAFFLIVLTFLATLLTSNQTTFAASSPLIEIHQPASTDLVVTVYWNYTLPEGCSVEDRDILFQAISAAQIILKKSIYRFLEENPGQFDELALLKFVNVSTPSKAEVIYSVYYDAKPESLGYVTYIYRSNQPYNMGLNCWMVGRYSGGSILDVALHELLHTLGVGHAFTRYTPEGELEVMFPAGSPDDPQTFPSTLDLYALYSVIIKKSYRPDMDVNITLPRSIEWKVLKPYSIEVQELLSQLDNARSKITSLEDEVMDLRDDIKRLETERNSLALENKRLNASLVSLQKLVERLEDRNADLELRLSEYEDMVSSLNQSLAEAYEKINAQQEEIQNLKDVNQQLSLQLSELQTSLSRAEAENQALRQQLQQANQTIQALAILIICLTAATIAAITLKKRR